jgi:hypothetical protein
MKMWNNFKKAATSYIELYFGGFLLQENLLKWYSHKFPF